MVVTNFRFVTFEDGLQDLKVVEQMLYPSGSRISVPLIVDDVESWRG
jgi:hypothetical protein